MSSWNSTEQKIVDFEPRPFPDHPGWIQVDCGCCGGIMWGGEYPVECRRCKGGGVVALHKKSKRIALYPGGQFLGSWPEWVDEGVEE